MSLLLHVLHTQKKQVEFRSKKTYGRKKKEKLDVADLDLAGNSNNNVRFLKKIYDTHTHTPTIPTHTEENTQTLHTGQDEDAGSKTICQEEILVQGFGFAVLGGTGQRCVAKS